MKLNISSDLSVDAELVLTERTCVIGQSGSGKSYTVAVICEELVKNNLGFCIIDTEGEYSSLKEKYKLLWIGGSNSDIDIETADFDALSKSIIEKSAATIFDVSDVMEPKETLS